ncbi:MAG TPA: mannosyltransferase, partial [Salinimicrobium sp.]|nr:mannosyltransferase [Salinimicrobium sp.]
FGKKILDQIGLPKNKIFWYFLNPFIIIELTGNLHLESVMIFFLLTSFYLLLRGKLIFGAVLFACSVGVKLIPLIFLPLLFKKLGAKKFLIYALVIAFSLLLLFIPLLSDEFLANYLATTALWFEKFEFNAGIYYLIRYLGYEFTGYNIIALAGKILAAIVLCFVILLSFLRKNKETRTLLTSMVCAISVYYFLATTVHPWYLALPLILSIFTTYKFVQLWAFLVILSYAAYGLSGFEENQFLIAIEYIFVLGFLTWELIGKKMGKKKTLP